ncbi:unnamed protein product [Oncorhynchus mykiss]|uniref:Ribosome receptor lysine/proline rich domain-containing protein n=1 Tax=Oncorhynchus mykiss TaxID=8022 RepID=A0A060VMV0_ONCMY|nr:unnamed protein product [Oncorhynchus mykiss]
MDLYDPQTLGIMVFGGFMFISALGIVLVSTFSMKETSYEEALAQQRRELGKMAPPSQLTKKDKKKDKVSEKKNRGKKKDDKPNGKLPESEPEEVPVAVPEPTPAPERVTAPAPAPERATAPAPAPEPTTHPAPPAQAATTPIAPSKPAPVLEAVTKEVPVMAVPPVGSQQTAAKAQEAKAQEARAQEARAQEARAQEARAQEARAQEARAQEARAQEAQNPSKKKASSKKKAESGKEACNFWLPLKNRATEQCIQRFEANFIMTHLLGVSIPVDSGLDSPLYLPYRALVSTVSSMVISQGEAQRLIEILSDKAGIRQDTWQMATQKGDPVAVMKKQLEENQKQLATQQEDATAAKNRLRELTKELSAEKSKVASVETRLSSQLSSREQEMIALQARMQASYQDHVAQTQKLTAKVISLQEQLESGPTAQLACLSTECYMPISEYTHVTIISPPDFSLSLSLSLTHTPVVYLLLSLFVVISYPELAVTILTVVLQNIKICLTLPQASRVESEQVLQRRLEEVSEELRSSQSTLEKAQQDATSVADIQVHLGRIEADLKERSAQVEALTAQLEQTELEKGQLEDQVESINVLLEASHNRDVDEDTEGNSTELEQLKSSLQDRDSQLASLQQELKHLQELKQEASVSTSLFQYHFITTHHCLMLVNNVVLHSRMKERTSQEVKQPKETSEQAQSSTAVSSSPTLT